VQAQTAAKAAMLNGPITITAVSVVCLQAKRGKHSSKEVSVPRINDVSAPGQGARAKQYLPFLQRGGKLLGLVESVSSGECDAGGPVGAFVYCVLLQRCFVAACSSLWLFQHRSCGGPIRAICCSVCSLDSCWPN
jgi:hypothetical protein